MSRNDTARQLAQLNATVERLNERISDILMLKEPGTAQAAEAYEGLRKKIVASDRTRQQHLAHLSRIDLAIRRGEGAEALAMLLRELMAETGLQRLDTADGPAAAFFEVVGEGEGELEVVQPAYVDPIDDHGLRPIMTGIARVVDASELESIQGYADQGAKQ